MRDMEYLKIRAEKKFDLKVKVIDENIIMLHSKKFSYDSWMIEERESEFILWHLDKKKNYKKKCSYHIQRRVKKKNKKYLLDTIIEHNDYSAFYKNFKKINLVDRVLHGVSL